MNNEIFRNKFSSHLMIMSLCTDMKLTKVSHERELTFTVSLKLTLTMISPKSIRQIRKKKYCECWVKKDVSQAILEISAIEVSFVFLNDS